MKNLILSFACIISTQVFAGGGSSVGPGAPLFQYICEDSSQNISVSILNHFPDYSKDNIVAQTEIPWNQTLDENVQRIAGQTPGTNLVYKGQRFQLSLHTDSAPVVHDGKTYISGELRDFVREQAAMKPITLPLTCEVLLEHF